MPLLVEKLLLKTYDSDPKGLYKALQKKGDIVALKSNASGGLGSTLLSPPTREALDIDSTGQTVRLVAKNLHKLEELAEKYHVGDHSNGYNRNKNKQLICLALIVRQPVTAESYKIIRQAFLRLVTTYSTKYGYKDQYREAGGLILHMIEEKKEQFEKEAKVIENEEIKQKLANTALANHSRASSESKIHEHTISTPSYSPSQMEPYSAGSSIQTPPSNLNLTPRSNSGHSISQHSMSQSNEEEKASPSINSQQKIERAMVKETLARMRASTIHPNKSITYQLKDIKSAQKIYFKNHIYQFNLKQLTFLSGYMYDIQRSRRPDEHSFDDIRSESSRIRRLFGFRKGNTQTWQDVAAYLQALLLEKLLKEQRAERFQKLALPSLEYNNYARLFSHSYTRYKWSTPTVLKQFRDTCRETPEGESPAQPTRSLSTGPS